MKDIKKVALAAKTPIIALIILEFLWWVIDFYGPLESIALILKLAFFAWAGFEAARSCGFVMKLSIMAGAVAGFITLIAEYIFMLIFYPGWYEFSEWLGELILWTVLAGLIAIVGHMFAEHKQKDSREESVSSSDSTDQNREENQ